MNRRRRRLREIPFSLDSFLDVVANIVGIIIRLILVAWVGARTYSGLVPAPAPVAPSAAIMLPPIHDPLEDDLARHRRELEQAHERLLQQLRELGPLHDQQETTGRELAMLSNQRQELEQQGTALGQVLAEKKQASQNLVPSLAGLRERGKQLLEEIKALEKLPPAKKALHYRAPVSHQVQHEDEVFFECRAGRVTYIDIPAFQAEIRATIRDRMDEIRKQGRLEGVTQPSGAFRLRYSFELDRLSNTGRLEHQGIFEPLLPVRGEPLEAALASGSDFHHVIDSLDPSQAVITFWVYPDSFALYRRLRDFLYERNLEVAARPLPEGASMGESSHGTKSRGQ
jgi:hypothetical protein